MNIEKELITKIDDITTESNSQIDRNNIKEIAKENIFNFVNAYIKKSTSTSVLKQKVDTLLLAKLEKEDEDVPYGVLIKLVEILSKGETEAATPILKILEASIKMEKESEMFPPDKPLLGLDGIVTIEQTKKLKELLDLIDVHNKLKQSEFTEGEK
jgi:hypothetical protein